MGSLCEYWIGFRRIPWKMKNITEERWGKTPTSKWGKTPTGKHRQWAFCPICKYSRRRYKRYIGKVTSAKRGEMMNVLAESNDAKQFRLPTVRYLGGLLSLTSRKSECCFAFHNIVGCLVSPWISDIWKIKSNALQFTYFAWLPRLIRQNHSPWAFCPMQMGLLPRRWGRTPIL